MFYPGLEKIQILTRRFDINLGVTPAYLALGSFLMGLSELVGVTAVFPMILVIMNPDLLQGDNLLASIHKFFKLEDAREFVALLGAGIATIFITKALFNIFYLRYEFNLLAKWRAELSGKIYSYNMNSPYDLFIKKNSSEMMTLITNHVPNIVNNYIHPIINMYGYTLTLILLIGYIVYLNWIAAILVTITGGSLLFVQGHVHRKKLRALNIKASLLQSLQYKLLQQSFFGFKETKIYAKQDHFLKNFSTTMKELGLTEEKALYYRALPGITVELVILLSTIVVFAVLMYTEEHINVIAAQLGAMAMAAFRMIPMINRSITSMVMMHGSRHSLDVILRECDQNFISQNKAVSSTSELIFNKEMRLSNISYSYAPETPVLKEINFSIAPGQFVGITGPSGGGKSTLSHIILGLITNYSGEFTVDNTPVTESNTPALHKMTGFVDQSIFLMDGSIAENVAFGIDLDKIDRDKVEQSLRKAQLWDHVSKLEEGMDTQVGELGKHLSGGQKQRLGIARALYRDIKILILDEASAALDVETEHNFFAFLESLKGEITVIMIAHRLSTLKGCDRVDFIDGGTIVDSGSFSNLYHRNQKFKNFIDYLQIEINQHDI